FALSVHERVRLQSINNALIFYLFNLDKNDVAHILSTFSGIDSKLDIELRTPMLTCVAFHDLMHMGIENFLTLNHGEGWMLPEYLTLAEYGLGYEDRARKPQPVASRLGPRFLPWQIQGIPDERWWESELYARNLMSLGLPHLQQELHSELA